MTGAVAAISCMALEPINQLACIGITTRISAILCWEERGEGKSIKIIDMNRERERERERESE